MCQEFVPVTGSSFINRLNSLKSLKNSTAFMPFCGNRRRLRELGVCLWGGDFFEKLSQSEQLYG